MIYLKSLLAGTVAMLVMLVLVVVSLAVWQYFAMVRTGSGGIGVILFDVDLVLLLFILLAIFTAGFYWRFRRSAAKRSGF